MTIPEDVRLTSEAEKLWLEAQRLADVRECSGMEWGSARACELQEDVNELQAAAEYVGWLAERRYNLAQGDYLAQLGDGPENYKMNGVY